MEKENEELKLIIGDLIQILLYSSTNYHDDGVIQHDHKMFDGCDVDQLKALRERISNL